MTNTPKEINELKTSDRPERIYSGATKPTYFYTTQRDLSAKELETFSMLLGKQPNQQ